jgi:hypothetical protein
LLAGGTQRWDPRMTPRAEITGIVLDIAGQPAPGTNICAFGGKDTRAAYRKADAQGRFLLAPLDPGAMYTVHAEVRLAGGGIAVAQREGVKAGSDIELRPQPADVPTARLRGRVMLTDGRPAAGHVVHLTPLDGDSGMVVATDGEGRFEFGPSLPTSLRLSVGRAGSSNRAIAEFGVYELRAGATTDAGDLMLSTPGSVRVRVNGVVDEQAAVALFRDGVHVASRLVGKEPVKWDDLAPGPYSVCILRKGDAPLCGLTEFEVSEGSVVEPVVTVSSASCRELQFTVPDVGPTGPLLVVATDGARHTLMVDWCFVRDHRASAAIALPAGATMVKASSADGFLGTAIVGATGPIVVALQRTK